MSRFREYREMGAAFGAALLFCAIFGGGVVLWWNHRDAVRAREDADYAAAVFEPVAPGAEVLASRKWHRRDWSANWDCTYAVIRLPKNALIQPPSVPQADAPWWLRLPETWRPTPAAPLGDSTRDAVSSCRRYWPDALGAELAAAFDEPGGFYARGPVGETVHVWSVPRGIAARIRFGD